MIRAAIQIGLLHMAVAMTLVPINSTLNRVMIKELGLSATLVVLLASLPYLFSPLQVAIGSFSDRHPLGGRRRSPYILAGLLLCAAGVAAAPYCAYLLAGRFWLGLAVGAGPLLPPGARGRPADRPGRPGRPGAAQRSWCRAPARALGTCPAQRGEQSAGPAFLRIPAAPAFGGVRAGPDPGTLRWGGAGPAHRPVHPADRHLGGKLPGCHVAGRRAGAPAGQKDHRLP